MILFCIINWMDLSKLVGSMSIIFVVSKDVLICVGCSDKLFVAYVNVTEHASLSNLNIWHLISEKVFSTVFQLKSETANFSLFLRNSFLAVDPKI